MNELCVQVFPDALGTTLPTKTALLDAADRYFRHNRLAEYILPSILLFSVQALPTTSDSKPSLRLARIEVSEPMATKLKPSSKS